MDGIQGSPGPKGPDGERGSTGPPGYPGMAGHPGMNGMQGPPGKEGEAGQPGPDGYGGMSGNFGLSGEPGSDANYCKCPGRQGKKFPSPPELSTPPTEEVSKVPEDSARYDGPAPPTGEPAEQGYGAEPAATDKPVFRQIPDVHTNAEQKNNAYVFGQPLKRVDESAEVEQQ